MTARFSTLAAAQLWASTYGLPYAYRITHEGGEYVVTFDTREPFGC